MSDATHALDESGLVCSCEARFTDPDIAAKHVALTPLQRGILETFFAVMDHGHFSPESQAAAAEVTSLVLRAPALPGERADGEDRT